MNATIEFEFLSVTATELRVGDRILIWEEGGVRPSLAAVTQPPHEMSLHAVVGGVAVQPHSLWPAMHIPTDRAGYVRFLHERLVVLRSTSTATEVKP